MPVKKPPVLFLLMLFTLNLSQPRFTNEPCRRLWALRGRCRNSRRSRGGFLRSLGSNLLRGLPGSLHRRFLRSGFLGGGWLSGLGRRSSFGSDPGPTSLGGVGNPPCFRSLNADPMRCPLQPLLFRQAPTYLSLPPFTRPCLSTATRTGNSEWPVKGDTEYRTTQPGRPYIHTALASGRASRR